MEQKELILEAIWNQLQEHKDNDLPELYYFEPYREFNFIQEGEPISDDDAKKILTKQIEESLKKYNKVYLYSCRDNRLISIEEDENDYTDKQYLEEYYEKQGDLELYIGFD